MWCRFGKRGFDLLVAGGLLIVAAPVVAVVALLVRLGMGSPVLFRQQRPGLHGRPFTILKFRTMTSRTGPDGRPLPDAERLTRLGRFLRRTSLDELPELWNVLRGDMSLVGPRPLLMEYLPLYSDFQRRRHEVRPGITGLAQVQGRNDLPWSRRFELDVQYVEHCSFLLDLRVLLRTFSKVLTGEGVSRSGHATVPYFTGNEPGPS